MQLRLGEGALHAEHEAVVELGGVVTAVLVDHERAGDGAQFEQAVPVLVRSRQPGGLQGEDRTDLTHRHIADQGLEVRTLGRCRAGLSEIAVEDPNLLWVPAERSSLVQQVVLAVRALLVRTDLRQRRLANVDAGLPRQVSIGDFGHHGHRAPPDRTAGRRRQDKTQPCRRGWRPPWRSRGRRGPGPWRFTPDTPVAAGVPY